MYYELFTGANTLNESLNLSQDSGRFARVNYVHTGHCEHHYKTD
jgi:hypothetical protein